jgi:hypothetical protein
VSEKVSVLPKEVNKKNPKGAYMAIIENKNQPFERPSQGRFLATVIDCIDIGKRVDAKGVEQQRYRVVWVLDRSDSHNRPFRVMWDVNAKITPPFKNKQASNLYKIAEGVFGTPPGLLFDTESLIGRSNELTLVKEGEYVNIKVILPLPEGAVGPKAPEGFVRDNGEAKAKAATAQTQAATTVGNTPTAQPTVQGQANPVVTQEEDAVF